MRCQFCSAPMPKQGFVCQFCRKRNSLNMSTLPKVEIVDVGEKYNCPVCENRLENINIGSKKEVLIQHCSKCDGVFIKENIMKQIIEKQTVDRQKFDYLMVRFIQNNPRYETNKKDKYKKCPICSKMMQRYNYGAVSGVILDRCLNQHGIWLDAGELKQIIEWKYYGGVVKEDESISSAKNLNYTDESYSSAREFYKISTKLDQKRQKENQFVKDRWSGNNYGDESIFDIVKDIASFFVK